MMTLLQANPYESMDAGSSAAAAGLGIGVMLFYFAIIGLLLFCLYKIFKKAGRDDAWAAFIPIYNTIVLMDIVKKPMWWFILLMIPFVNIIFGIIVAYRLSKFFGKDILMTILIFFIVGIPMLAFGDAVYNPDALPDDRK